MTVIKRALRMGLDFINPAIGERIDDTRYFQKLARRPPELMWEALWRGPDLRLDAGGFQAGHELYVVGGYRDVDHVLSVIDILDLKKCRWTGRVVMPPNVPQSHHGLCFDGERYAYFVSGQLGNQCHPAVYECFVFDVKTRKWGRLPDVPEPRYVPVVKLWNGRLHVVAGSKPDRHTPADDHWSLAVEDGRAAESEWRREPPIPRGGTHRSSAVLEDCFYVFGGQEGDHIAVPGDPCYICTGDLVCEKMISETFRLKPGAEQWERMADMPVHVSHVEFATLTVNGKAVIVGGMADRDPESMLISLTDAVQVYDPVTDTWSVADRYPYRIKSPVAAYYDGRLYATAGQKERGRADPTPGWYDNRAWRARFTP